MLDRQNSANGRALSDHDSETGSVSAFPERKHKLEQWSPKNSMMCTQSPGESMGYGKMDLVVRPMEGFGIVTPTAPKSFHKSGSQRTLDSWKASGEKFFDFGDDVDDDELEDTDTTEDPGIATTFSSPAFKSALSKDTDRALTESAEGVESNRDTDSKSFKSPEPRELQVKTDMRSGGSASSTSESSDGVFEDEEDDWLSSSAFPPRTGGRRVSFDSCQESAAYGPEVVMYTVVYTATVGPHSSLNRSTGRARTAETRGYWLETCLWGTSQSGALLKGDNTPGENAQALYKGVAQEIFRIDDSIALSTCSVDHLVKQAGAGELFQPFGATNATLNAATFLEEGSRLAVWQRACQRTMEYADFGAAPTISQMTSKLDVSARRSSVHSLHSGPSSGPPDDSNFDLETSPRTSAGSFHGSPHSFRPIQRIGSEGAPLTELSLSSKKSSRQLRAHHTTLSPPMPGQGGQYNQSSSSSNLALPRVPSFPEGGFEGLDKIADGRKPENESTTGSNVDRKWRLPRVVFSALLLANMNKATLDLDSLTARSMKALLEDGLVTENMSLQIIKRRQWARFVQRVRSIALYYQEVGDEAQNMLEEGAEEVRQDADGVTIVKSFGAATAGHTSTYSTGMSFGATTGITDESEDQNESILPTAWPGTGHYACMLPDTSMPASNDLMSMGPKSSAGTGCVVLHVPAQPTDDPKVGDVITFFICDPSKACDIPIDAGPWLNRTCLQYAGMRTDGDEVVRQSFDTGIATNDALTPEDADDIGIRASVADIAKVSLNSGKNDINSTPAPKRGPATGTNLTTNAPDAKFLELEELSKNVVQQVGIAHKHTMVESCLLQLKQTNPRLPMTALFLNKALQACEQAVCHIPLQELFDVLQQAVEATNPIMPDNSMPGSSMPGNSSVSASHADGGAVSASGGGVAQTSDVAADTTYESEAFSSTGEPLVAPLISINNQVEEPAAIADGSPAPMAGGTPGAINLFRFQFDFFFWFL